MQIDIVQQQNDLRAYFGKLDWLPFANFLNAGDNIAYLLTKKTVVMRQMFNPLVQLRAGLLDQWVLSVKPTRPNQ